MFVGRTPQHGLVEFRGLYQEHSASHGSPTVHMTIVFTEIKCFPISPFKQHQIIVVTRVVRVLLGVILWMQMFNGNSVMFRPVQVSFADLLLRCVFFFSTSDDVKS